jgi:DNA-binding response OmpR family regulator
VSVLIVAPSAGLAASLQTALQQAGMATELAGSGAEALAHQQERPAAVVVVDLALPDMRGEALLARLAAAGRSGTIAIAADAAAARRLHGKAKPADDVVGQPVAPKALAARVLAVHRRRRRPEGGDAPPSISIDRARQAVVDAHGRWTPLSRAELAALTTLLEAEGASVSSDWLARIALGKLLLDGDREVQELVAGLRRKLAAHGVSPRTIRSVRGQGFVITDPTVFAE